MSEPEQRPVRLAGVTDEAGPDLDTQLAVIARLGWDALELRTVDGRTVADLPDAAFARLVERVRGAGLSAVCVAARAAGRPRRLGQVEPDLGELDVLAERCAALGTRFVRVRAYPVTRWSDDDVLRWMRLLAGRAERAGLVLLHEGCSGWIGADPARALRLLDEVASPALGLAVDTVGASRAGPEPYDVLAALVAAAGERILHVRITDADGDAEDPEYRYPGAGSCRVGDQLALLARAGYTGAVSIEPRMVLPRHGDARGPDVFVEYGRRAALLVDRAGFGAGLAGAAR